MSSSSSDKASLAAVYAYHQQTKHGFERYAAGPGSLDWATQPNPFRAFDGAERIPLPLVASRNSVGYADLFEPGRVPAMEADLDAIGLLLELSFGLSAWKVYGEARWALRCNPSSGNLHPTEAYLVTAAQSELTGGVYHYHSHDHALERRCRAQLELPGYLIALSSIHWREAWKYGERAFRYCQHDVGHALGSLNYAASVLGWRCRLLDEWGDDDIAVLLGLDRVDDFREAEAEAPDLVCWVGPPEREPATVDIDRLVGAVRTGHWTGRANKLSVLHRQDWKAIEAVHAATWKPRTPTVPAAPLLECNAAVFRCRSAARAASVIRQRRSAQAFDSVTTISAAALYRMLQSTLPGTNRVPFAGWPWPPRIHLALFVHRVQGLTPGLYCFWRGGETLASFRPLFRAEFEWTRSDPDGFPLFQLLDGDARQAAQVLSCHQSIAADSAFSVGMLAEFDDGLREGAWVYRRLFWETGLIGQVLYLEAEAAGVRGTGIGCFFDDPVHDMLGLEGRRLQSLYHFTVGGALVDERLQTLPAYGHLDGARSLDG